MPVCSTTQSPICPLSGSWPAVDGEASPAASSRPRHGRVPCRLGVGGGRGTIRLVGPDDLPEGSPPNDSPQLLRDVFTAAGGTHDDWAEFDRVMSSERRAAVFVDPDRVRRTVDSATTGGPAKASRRVRRWPTIMLFLGVENTSSPRSSMTLDDEPPRCGSGSQPASSLPTLAGRQKVRRMLQRG